MELKKVYKSRRTAPREIDSLTPQVPLITISKEELKKVYKSRRRAPYRGINSLIPQVPLLGKIHLEFEKTLTHRSNNKPEQLNRVLGITKPHRNYKSVQWIADTIDSSQTGKGISSRIKTNLIKKKKLLDIMRCLITDAMWYHETLKFSISNHIGKIVMKTKIKNRWENRERIPVIVKLNIPSIARRLKVSDILIWKYISGMEKVGLIQRPDSLKKYSSVMGAYRVIGGYYTYDKKRHGGNKDIPDVQPVPVYFWGRTQQGIKEKLCQFSLVIDNRRLYSQPNPNYIVTES